MLLDGSGGDGLRAARAPPPVWLAHRQTWIIINSSIDVEEVGVVVGGLWRYGRNLYFRGPTDPHGGSLRVAEPRSVGGPSCILPLTDLCPDLD
jgi:hypothetical protein